MNRLSSSLAFRVFLMILTICLTGLAVSAMAHETEQKIPNPGFRPQSEYAPAFLEALDTATIAVLPTIVRRTDRTAHSFASQAQIVAFLNESGIAAAEMKARRIDLGLLRRPSQWEIFQYGAESIAAKLAGYETGADYTFVMELLLPEPNGVFGIEVYVLDHQGRNAFSFILNSHHQMFVDAKLVAGSSSEEARTRMIEDATRVGMTALEQQINQARECAALAAANTRNIGPGIFHNFESGLASRTESHGITLGFSTFSDGHSTANISTTTDHPPRPDEADGNHVVQLDMNVTGWAGIVKVFENESFDTWISYDWSDFDVFSFWLYGSNSGALLFVDIIDNRNPCSTVDDAERYAVEFVDDFSGWRQIMIPFADMFRKEIGNGAPDDGLDLSNVHGWGLGATKTNGPITFYMDDFELRSASSEAANAEQAPPAVGYLAKLEDRQGVFYTVDSETPFTGKSIVHYENGQKKLEGDFKDGKREGLHTMWHGNGQKKLEGNFKDGKPEGLHTFWYENGKIDEEECYRNGEEVLLSECKNNTYEQGWEMLQNSDWEGAKAKFTTVIELVPDEWSAWMNRGVAKQNLGDWKGAMEDFNQAVKLDPEGYEVYLHRGHLRMRMREYEGAIEDLDNGIQFSPNTRKFRQRLSSAYSDRSLAKGYVDDFAGAIKDWKKALELNPQVVKTLTGPGTPIIFRGSLDEVRDFIEIEPKVVLTTNLMGYTLLHLLMKSENPNSAEVCRFLIEAGADVNAKEREGNSPLHFAMYRDTRMNLSSDVYLGTIRLLLAKGARVNATNWIDGTPLHSAVLTNADLPAIELLLKNGAKVNAKTKAKGSYTALHPAASEGRADLVELLLRNGADPNIKDGYGNTALDAARNNNQTEVVKILEHYGMGT